MPAAAIGSVMCRVAVARETGHSCALRPRALRCVGGAVERARGRDLGPQAPGPRASALADASGSRSGSRPPRGPDHRRGPPAPRRAAPRCARALRRRSALRDPGQGAASPEGVQRREITAAAVPGQHGFVGRDDGIGGYRETEPAWGGDRAVACPRRRSTTARRAVAPPHLSRAGGVQSRARWTRARATARGPRRSAGRRTPCGSPTSPTRPIDRR